MFAKAIKLATEYTRPVIISARFSDNSVKSAVGSFVILNEEGWIITAGHLFRAYTEYMKYMNESVEYKKNIQYIKNDKTLLHQQKKRKINNLKKNFYNQVKVIDYGFLWGDPCLWDDEYMIDVDSIVVNNDIDLAIAKIIDFKAGQINNYPKIIDPSKADIGTFLCKFGYPFNEAKSTWDKKNGRFQLDPDPYPFRPYPLEGMYTGDVDKGMSADTKYQKLFLETSSPGIMGHSGAPTFDTDGIIWAIHTNTEPLQLGFAIKHEQGNILTSEHQLINVGLGVHPEVIIQFLNDNKITFYIEKK